MDAYPGEGAAKQSGTVVIALGGRDRIRACPLV